MQVINFTVLTVKYVQIFMRCSCYWTTGFNAVSKHITVKFVHELGNTAVTALAQLFAARAHGKYPFSVVVDRACAQSI